MTTVSTLGGPKFKSPNYGRSNEGTDRRAGRRAGWTDSRLRARARRRAPVILFEADRQVGGLARTVVRDGYRFDLGGHRFFTKSAEVQAPVGGDARRRAARARRGCRGSSGAGASSTTRCDSPTSCARLARSSSRAAAPPTRAPSRAARAGRPRETFEDWVFNRFGRRLFELFFKTYTEKVWGMPTTEIRAEWAAQRIRRCRSGASCPALLNDGGDVRSLIEEFQYPRLGPGQMWEAMAAEIVGAGGQVRLGARVEELELDGGRVAAVHAGGRARGGRARRLVAAAARRRRARRPAAAGRGASGGAPGLRYRDFLIVALVVAARTCSPTTGSTCTIPRCRSGGSRTSAPGARRWCPTPGDVPRHGVLLLRGRRALERERRRARRARDARAGRDRAGRRGARRGRPRHARAEGVSGLRRRLRRRASDDPRRGWRGSRTSSRSVATGCIATTTPTTRC